MTERYIVSDETEHECYHEVSIRDTHNMSGPSLIWPLTPSKPAMVAEFMDRELAELVCRLLNEHQEKQQ